MLYVNQSSQDCVKYDNCVLVAVFFKAKMRNRTAGLGLKGSDYGGTAGDSERDLLKKMVSACLVCCRSRQPVASCQQAGIKQCM